MRDFTESQLIELFTKASTEAIKSSQSCFDEILGGHDRMPCGFAWVTLKGIKFNTKLGKMIRKIVHINDDKMIWNPGQYGGQNVYAKYDGARVYAQVLTEGGIEAVADSRWD